VTKSNPPVSDRAWLDVDLAALLRNARHFQSRIGVPLLPMVKANGYGLGAVPVALALEPVDPWGYGVATTDEGAELRRGGITRPVVVFTPLFPGGIDAMRSHQLIPVIGDFEALDAWTGQDGGPFHVEIDTGLSRAGFLWRDTALLATLGTRLAAAAGWQGIFTHFHSADTDLAATRDQAKRFASVLAALPRRPPLVHLSASAGAQVGTEYGADLARPGIFLYGGRAGTLTPEPVARLCARVVALRRLRAGDTVSYGATATVQSDSTIATLAIGYADGVPRALGSLGLVEINGAIVRIIGRVTMDMLMVEAGETPVRLGDTGILFGGRVSLDDQAARAGTISYELLTSISPRVERRYRDLS
jgi:alanine racemase